MWSYVTAQLPELVAAQFPVDPKRQSILGHSMGGHGALPQPCAIPTATRSQRLCADRRTLACAVGYQGRSRLSRRRQAEHGAGTTRWR